MTVLITPANSSRSSFVGHYKNLDDELAIAVLLQDGMMLFANAKPANDSDAARKAALAQAQQELEQQLAIYKKIQQNNSRTKDESATKIVEIAYVGRPVWQKSTKDLYPNTKAQFTTIDKPYHIKITKNKNHHLAIEKSSTVLFDQKALAKTTAIKKGLEKIRIAAIAHFKAKSPDKDFKDEKSVLPLEIQKLWNTFDHLFANLEWLCSPAAPADWYPPNGKQDSEYEQNFVYLHMSNFFKQTLKDTKASAYSHTQRIDIFLGYMKRFVDSFESDHIQKDDFKKYRFFEYLNANSGDCFDKRMEASIALGETGQLQLFDAWKLILSKENASRKVAGTPAIEDSDDLDFTEMLKLAKKYHYLVGSHDPVELARYLLSLNPKIDIKKLVAVVCYQDQVLTSHDPKKQTYTPSQWNGIFALISVRLTPDDINVLTATKNAVQRNKQNVLALASGVWSRGLVSDPETTGDPRLVRLRHQEAYLTTLTSTPEQRVLYRAQNNDWAAVQLSVTSAAHLDVNYRDGKNTILHLAVQNAIQLLKLIPSPPKIQVSAPETTINTPVVSSDEKLTPEQTARAEFKKEMAKREADKLRPQAKANLNYVAMLVVREAALFLLNHKDETPFKLVLNAYEQYPLVEFFKLIKTTYQFALPDDRLLIIAVLKDAKRDLEAAELETIKDETILIELAQQGEFDTLVQFLKRHQRFNINFKDEHGKSALHYAAAACHVNAVRELCERGATAFEVPVNEKDDKVAADEKVPAPFALAVANTATPNSKTVVLKILAGVCSDPAAAVLQFAQRNQWQVISEFYKNSGTITQLRTIKNTHQTALHFAVHAANADAKNDQMGAILAATTAICGSLGRNSYRNQFKDKANLAPLQYALTQNSFSVAKAILQHGSHLLTEKEINDTVRNILNNKQLLDFERFLTDLNVDTISIENKRMLAGKLFYNLLETTKDPLETHAYAIRLGALYKKLPYLDERQGSLKSKVGAHTWGNKETSNTWVGLMEMVKHKINHFGLNGFDLTKPEYKELYAFIKIKRKEHFFQSIYLRFTSSPLITRSQRIADKGRTDLKEAQKMLADDQAKFKHLLV